MAVLFSIADGNINATASWGVVEATSFQGTPNTVLSSNFSASLITGTSFTLANAVTVAGVALQLSGRVASPTGTLNVQLFDVTGAAIVAQVTINISDLPNSNGVGANHIDWTYFKFATPVTTVAGRSYAIRVQASVSTQISLYYVTSLTNMNRALITTTSQVPITNDQLIIAGSYTSAGVNSNVTITMNYNSVNYVIMGNIWVSSKGILTFLTNALTYLPIAGYIVVGQGGIFNIGTSLAPITVRAEIQVLCTTALQYQIWVYGNMTTYGASKTIATKLAADVIVGATNSITTTSTNWKIFDIIVVPSTTRTSTQFEAITLNSDASGTTLTHNAYTFAHGGNATTKVQADIVNISRNIQIRSNGTPFANKTNIQIFANSITSFYYTTFNGLGTGTTLTNSGICVNTLNTGYTFDMQYCVISEGTQAAANTANIALSVASTIGTTISNNIFYGLGWSATVVNTLNLIIIDDGNYIIGCLSTTQVLLATTMGSNNVFSSNNTPALTGFVNNASNNSFYSNNTIGLNIVNPTTTGNLNLTNFLIWRNNTFGLRFEISGLGYQRNNIISFNGLYCFGNTTASITVLGRVYEKIYFYNSFFYGGTTLVQPTHITNSNSISVDAFYYHNCYLGYSDTSLTTSPFGSGFLFNGFFNNVSTIFSNCYFNGSLNQTGFYLGTNLNGNMISLNHNGVADSNRQWVDIGTISTDFVIYKSVPKSLRMTIQFPTTLKMSSPLVKVPVKIGTTCTISVFVRKSITADSSVYGGTAPRLMYAFNPVLGNLTETIGDTTKNLFQYPQNFDNSYWQKSASSITPDSLSVAAPDGTFTADLFVEDNTTTRHRIIVAGTIPVSIGTTYNLSVYAKKANHDWIQLNPVYDTFFGGNNWANFNLATGTIGTTGNQAIASITSVGDGWYRLSLQCNVIASGSTFLNLFTSTNNTNSGRYPSYTGTNAQCFYIWGAQFTLGSTLLPYYDNGQWEQLTYTTGTFSNDGVAEFYVDCDGTVGFINIDDWSVDTSVDSRGQDYWGVNATYVEPDFKRGTRSYTFVK
jgi:hypothetical protein